MLAVEFGLDEDADHVAARVGAAFGDDLGEEVVEPLRRLEATFDLDRDADELDRLAVEERELLGWEPEHPGDDMDGERPEQLPDQIGVAAVREVVDEAVDDRADQVNLPPVHRLAGEGLLDEGAVGVMLRLVHLEDGVAHDESHAVRVPRRRERLPVLQDSLDRLEGQWGERGHVRVREGRVEGLIETEPLRERAGEDRALGSQLVEQRIRVPDRARAGRLVEDHEGVVLLLGGVGSDIAHRF